MTEMSKELGRLKALQPHSNQRRDPNYVQTPPIVQAISEDTGAPRTDGQPRLYQPNKRQCFNCKSDDHFIKDCPQPRSNFRMDTATITEPVVVNRSTNSGDVDQGRRTYIRLYVNGVPRKVLLDTGSDVTLFPSSAVEGVKITECSTKIKAANGTSIRLRGTAVVDIRMGDNRFEVTGFVTDHVAEVMFGFDCMREHNAIWDFKNDQITWDGIIHKLCDKIGPTWCRRVVLQADSVVPSRSEVNLQTKVVFNDLTQPRPEIEPP